MSHINNIHSGLEDNDNFDTYRSSDEEADDLVNLDSSLLTSFREYSKVRQDSRYDLTKSQVTCIRLLLRLRATKASLNTYESMMEWHLEESGKMLPGQTLSQCKDYISSHTIYSTLRLRYKFNPYCGYKLDKVILPHSQAAVKIVKYNAKAVITSLLTDPRLCDEDYLFFDNNPLQPPPDNITEIQDLNTGRAYTATYEKLIKDSSKQILLPVIFYIDAATTGQFVELPVTALKITLGIFNRKARDKNHLWRVLGYVPQVSPRVSRGKRIIADSNHAESRLELEDLLDNEGDEINKALPKAQDFHTILSAILESYIDLQNTGFVWDLAYKGHMYKNMQFVLFTPFVKVDSDEADKLCGKFKSRTRNVANLCRYCVCPTAESDNFNATYGLKTQPWISRLIAQNRVTQLKDISQHPLDNAWYKVRFGLHSEQGIHGSCPMEMLHALLLGVFKYMRECFWDRMGSKSNLASRFDALACVLGKTLSRQSQRDLPRTSFSKGLNEGRLMAKDHSGILLLIAASVKTTLGRSLLKSRKYFEVDAHLRDWATLVETLLQWEMWLKSDTLRVSDVHRAKRKHRFIMYLIKKVGNRKKGMGLKLLKYHAIMHMAKDILNFGVPMEFDTGSNESGHKPTKKAALLTQKNQETFNEQTANRLDELDLLGYAEEELTGNKIWEYGKHTQNIVQVTPPPPKSTILGAKYTIGRNHETNDLVVKTVSGKEGNHSIEQPFIQFVDQLQQLLSQFVPRLVIQTELRRNNIIFRAHPRYRKKVWRDWVIINWAGFGQLPAKIWGFIDLLSIPPNTGLEYGSCKLQPVVYAIVESASYNLDEELVKESDLFVPLTKEMDTTYSQEGLNLKFLLVDVEAFVKPAAVIPDIGGSPDSYFLLKDRSEWKEDFVKWLREPHTLDEMLDSDDEVGSSSEDDEGLTDDESSDQKEEEDEDVMDQSDSGSEEDEYAD